MLPAARCWRVSSPARALPDLTVAYFADNDFRSHEVGPFAALPVVERVDGMLGDAFAAAGGIDRVLADTCVIVTSDHGHCDVLDRDDAIIRLDRVFGEFRQAELGRAWHEHDEIMICPNMRAAQIYVHRITADLVDRIAREALLDPRIDQVIWRTSNTNPGADGYTVLTSHGRLTFTRRAADSGASEDPFGGRWRWEGESDAVDLLMDGRTIEFGRYPNAFERIAGVLDFDQSGAILGHGAAGLRVRGARRQASRRRRVAWRAARARFPQPRPHRRRARPPSALAALPLHRHRAALYAAVECADAVCARDAARIACASACLATAFPPVLPSSSVNVEVPSSSFFSSLAGTSIAHSSLRGLNAIGFRRRRQTGNTLPIVHSETRWHSRVNCFRIERVFRASSPSIVRCGVRRRSFLHAITR